MLHAGKTDTLNKIFISLFGARAGESIGFLGYLGYYGDWTCRGTYFPQGG